MLLEYCTFASVCVWRSLAPQFVRELSVLVLVFVRHMTPCGFPCDLHEDVWRYLSIVCCSVHIAIGRWIVLPFRAHRGAAAFSIQYLAGCMRAVGLGGSIKSGSCTTAHLDPSRGAEQTGIHSVVQDISHRLSRAEKSFSFIILSRVSSRGRKSD